MKILMRNDKDKKWELVESNAYALETELQELLVESPEVISIDEIRPEAGPLVAAVREFNLPVGAVDILAFTARGDIAIIECKLAKNTQAKREVIGQILDYAAHIWGISYEELDQRIQSMSDHSLADLVHEHVGADWDEEQFRSNVRSALQQGNFILIIAVNEINDELNRIIRYVNAAGEPAFSFAALEMRRFNKSNAEMLVPHVFGPVQSPAAKPRTSSRKWDEQSFFETLHANGDMEAEDAARRILTWARNKATRVWWGEGVQFGSFVPVFHYGDVHYQLFAVYTYGMLETYFYWYQRKPPFDALEKRMELMSKLNDIEGITIPPDATERRPSIKLSALATPGTLEKFLAVYDWFIDEIKQ